MYTTQPTRRPRSAENVIPIEVYGTGWCAASQGVRRFLDRLGVPYAYRDVERDPEAARRVEWWTGGSLSHPTVQIGGQVLVEPSIEELEWVLNRHGVI